MEEKEKLYVNIQGDIISIEADGYPSRDFWYYSLEEAVERYKEVIGADEDEDFELVNVPYYYFYPFP